MGETAGSMRWLRNTTLNILVVLPADQKNRDCPHFPLSPFPPHFLSPFPPFPFPFPISSFPRDCPHFRPHFHFRPISAISVPFPPFRPHFRRRRALHFSSFKRQSVSILSAFSWLWLFTVNHNIIFVFIISITSPRELRYFPNIFCSKTLGIQK